MATLPQFNTSQTGPKPVLVQIEDQYNKRIDDDIGKLVDCFTDIVKVGEIVRSCESLLSLIGELKQNLLLNDTKTLTTLRQTRSERLIENTTAIKDRMQLMKKELAETVYDLETVFYRSLTDA
ncbi:hypothetical protein FB192DRAFT_1279700 [Mucor lusitanicus]|uniref:Mediator of RNA polymerase II transcription subunit 22 n=1 Tax=Mucor circinelloides f. lusitanicus TaxID=29924 RepID=A0A8H4F483_MUCCL|nr:hypothetical protein FB192DRAFT_1279700 [Mucor lusitanicus]